MSGKRLSCVLLADRHHRPTEGVRGLLETAFGTVVMVVDDACVSKSLTSTTITQDVHAFFCDQKHAWSPWRVGREERSSTTKYLDPETMIDRANNPVMRN
jgi:hypothetical protein